MLTLKEAVQNLFELLKKNSKVTKMLNKDDALTAAKGLYQSCAPNIEKDGQLTKVIMHDRRSYTKYGTNCGLLAAFCFCKTKHGD